MKDAKSRSLFENVNWWAQFKSKYNYNSKIQCQEDAKLMSGQLKNCKSF